jgi:hypothetical protein
MLRPYRALLLLPLFASFFLVSCGDGDRPFPVRTYTLGEKVELGHIIYQVFETQWLTHIGDGPDARIPQNRYFLVRFSAVNSAGGDLIVPNMTIQDDAGTTYTELSDGTGVPNWAGFLRSVKPAESVLGNLLFDAPPRRYKLKIADESGDRTALIDIPLSFSSETPEVATPGSAIRDKDKK